MQRYHFLRIYASWGERQAAGLHGTWDYRLTNAGLLVLHSWGGPVLVWGLSGGGLGAA